MKILVGIISNGVVSFDSDLFSGSIRDPEKIKRLGQLEKLNYGDAVMADKEFLIQDEIAEVGASLVIPHFLLNAINIY